jgi:hypothetical protein
MPSLMRYTVVHYIFALEPTDSKAMAKKAADRRHYAHRF